MSVKTDSDKKNKEQQTIAVNTIKVPKNNYYGTGKRKTAIAKVWLFPGTGNIIVNNNTQQGYFRRDILVEYATRPLRKLNLMEKYDIKVSCSGGGLSGQAGATQLGIARALLVLNPEFRKTLKPEGFLTRDAREKERKKYGKKRARKGYQFRKR